LGEVLTNPLRKKPLLRNTYARCFLWRQNNLEVNYSPIRISGGRGVFLEKASRSRQARQQKRDLRLETGNVRSLYRTGSLKAAARELARYKLDLVGVQVRWPEERRPLERLRRRWEDNIRMDFREAGCGCVDWMELAQDRDWCLALVSAVMNLRVP
jgi:hypothetical protein